jgi:hypothetical protein
MTDDACACGRGSGCQGRIATPANRLRLDYREEAARLGAPVRPIVDAHAHINGVRAAGVWREVCDLYGVERVYSQTQLAQAEQIRETLGDRVRFVAIPEYMSEDRKHAFTQGYLENVIEWNERFGAKMVKFWGAPRFLDYAEESGLDPREVFRFDAPWRMRVAEEAVSRGMMLMVHVADPDTWFKTTYAESGRYGTKAEQYESLERLLGAFDVPCLGAHMGGWPEDLGFLTGLLERHPKLVLDTSATKWMVRELSKHPREELIAFLTRFSGRILFGSDIVTSDDHLAPSDPENRRFGSQLASDEREAFDLYASRYWAQRVMWETGYEGESPIADPDLAMVEPEEYDAMSAPRLVGRGLSEDMLRVLYGGACAGTLDAWYERGVFDPGGTV